MTTLPALDQKFTTFIRPRKVESGEAPLKLTIEHGRRQFSVVLKVAENEHGDRISLRHLAETVYCETGIVPKDQKYYWRGLSWQDPDMGVWSPSLRDLGVRSGDKIQLVSFHAPFPDYADNEALKGIDEEMKKTLKEVTLTVHRIQGIDRGYVGGSKLMALTEVMNNVEDLKANLQKHIEDLNKLHFHHLNCLRQAKRRELTDEAQRQIDKCNHFSNIIFHKIAQSHFLSNGGPMFPRDIVGKRGEKAKSNSNNGGLRLMAPCAPKRGQGAWCARM